MIRRVSTMDELVMLDSGTVLRGPDWHAEVYVKFSDVEFYAPGNPTPYRASEVQIRGPYTVLWPLPAAVVAEEPEGFYVIPNHDAPDQDSLWDGTIHPTRAAAQASIDSAVREWGQDAGSHHVVALVPVKPEGEPTDV